MPGGTLGCLWGDATRVLQGPRPPRQHPGVTYGACDPTARAQRGGEGAAHVVPYVTPGHSEGRSSTVAVVPRSNARLAMEFANAASQILLPWTMHVRHRLD
eukprot:5940225-Prymnesium_polylepis.1